ncbi:hypothetical protein ACHAXN_007903 [Cyclotella atomus]|jgi:hypothetical protein
MTPYESFTVPTFRPKAPEKQVSVKDLSSQDLSELKKKDPFLYYSIPQVRRASFLQHDQMPIKGDEAQKVTRQSRLSFECHGDLLLDDLVAGIDQEMDDRFSQEDDLFMYMLSAMAASRNRKCKHVHTRNLNKFSVLLGRICTAYIFSGAV